MLTKICQEDLIRDGRRRMCEVCDSPVSHYCCNNFLLAKRPQALGQDYWAACDNTNCVNHQGEAVFQFSPDWEREEAI